MGGISAGIGGGAVWLIDGHDPDLGGASFGMRLPDALEEFQQDEER